MTPSPDRLPIPGADLPLPLQVLRELAEALRTIRFGSVELVIHDGRVVQLERREKLRFASGAPERGPAITD
jgi:hypothetical protein